MCNRRWIFAAVLVACGCLAWQFATPLAAQQKDKDKDADSKQTDEQKKEQELDVKYAGAYVKLVEATLAKYEETNKRLPNTIRPAVMQALQEAVRDARDRLKLAQGDEKNDSETYIAGAENDLRYSQEALRKAEAANLQFSGTISAVELARMKAEVELAKVRIEKARHLASESPLSNVRYELEQLREDVSELKLFVALLRDRN